MTHLVTVERAFDARALPASDAAAEALARFDSLLPGERFVFVASDGALSLLERLQAERAGLFEWSPLESGPRVWRTEITRRAAEAGSLRGVREALAWDHDRLDALEEAAFRARAAGDLPSAYDLLAAFSVGLLRHIRFEEELLFPAFEAASGLSPSGGPTSVMRQEHRAIRSLLEEITAGIGDAAADVDPLRRSLHAVLDDHNLKEERVLYPGTDELLGPERADLLVRRMQGCGTSPAPR